MAKVTPRSPSNRDTVLVRTQTGKTPNQGYKWWLADTKADKAMQLVGTALFLRDNLAYRYKHASLYTRLYSNIPLTGVAGASFNKIETGSQLPADRPTMNIIQSVVDTKTSRITQSRPRPMFLTDNGDYRSRNLAKKLNQFIQGEFYQTNVYELSREIVRDADVLGTGVIKILEDMNSRVALERRLAVNLLVDPTDSLFGKPRSLYELQLVDRAVLAEAFPEARALINKAQGAHASDQEAQKSVSDQVLVVEGWHLKSGKKAKDGRHVIACAEGMIFDEQWDKEKFPFVFLHSAPRILGFWGQGAAERLIGTQVEINKILITISKSINLVGVPRIFVEEGSKVVGSHFNNEIGAIIKYRGTKPVYEVANCVPVEMYQQLQRLIDYGFQQEGVNQLSSAGKKPAGLDAAVALREYDDLQSDRLSDFNKRYTQMHIDLAYAIFDKAKDIAKRDGKYQTVYPNKDGTKEIDLPKESLSDDPFVIQCFDVSALPKDPTGRMQRVVELMQTGMISTQEARRLLDYPDLEQNEKLANASEERILKALDEIVNEGKFTPPDPFMNPTLARDLSNQYYNLYIDAKLEKERAEMLRTFNSLAIELVKLSQPAPQPMPGTTPDSTLAPQPLTLPAQP